MVWNSAAEELFGWLNHYLDDAAPNLLRFVFLNAGAKKLIVDWRKRAERLVAEFRADCGKFVDHGSVKILIDELLMKSREFRQCWNQQDVVGRDGGERQFVHPTNGKLVFNQVTFRLATQHDIKLVVLLNN